jgi:hypothetical protein
MIVGHIGIDGNEKTDQLAGKGSKLLQLKVGRTYRESKTLYSNGILTPSGQSPMMVNRTPMLITSTTACHLSTKNRTVPLEKTSQETGPCNSAICDCGLDEQMNIS